MIKQNFLQIKKIITTRTRAETGSHILSWTLHKLMWECWMGSSTLRGVAVACRFECFNKPWALTNKVHIFAFWKDQLPQSSEERREFSTLKMEGAGTTETSVSD